MNTQKLSQKNRDILVRWQRAKLSYDVVDVLCPLSLRIGEDTSKETLRTRQHAWDEYLAAMEQLKELDEPKLIPLVECIHQKPPDVNLKTRDGWALWNRLATERNGAMQKLYELGRDVFDLFPEFPKSIQ